MDREQALEAAQIVQSLINLSEVSTLISNFVPAFLHRTVLKADEMYYLHGNFKLGGALSARMSSNNVNLQNQPSTGSRYAKQFKDCFRAPKGWVLVGADFDSLEDKVSALTTKDPNKIKVYTDGYDGHSLRAHAYFKDQMQSIDPDSVSSINSIANVYPKLRQTSKGPTFLLTYGGTFHGMMDQFGFSKEKAKAIETQYHELYQVSDKWVQDKLEEATKKGYVDLAFGVRLRTPILARTILNQRTTPYEAKAEGRTAGNALGQSYGLLNNRSANEFMDRVYKSQYRYDIIPIMQVHDSQYYLIRANLDILKFTNDNLIECMSWQDLPDLKHDQVKISAGLEVYYPSMAYPHSVPKKASLEELREFTDSIN